MAKGFWAGMAIKICDKLNGMCFAQLQWTAEMLTDSSLILSEWKLGRGLQDTCSDACERWVQLHQSGDSGDGSKGGFRELWKYLGVPSCGPSTCELSFPPSNHVVMMMT